MQRPSFFEKPIIVGKVEGKIRVRAAIKALLEDVLETDDLGGNLYIWLLKNNANLMTHKQNKIKN